MKNQGLNKILFILDVDECLQPDTCPSNSVCTNLIGSFSCSCIDNGFEYNGNSCVGKLKLNKNGFQNGLLCLNIFK